VLQNTAIQNRLLFARSVFHFGAILAVIVLLAIGLYAVAREAGKLLQLSREVSAADTSGLVQGSSPESRRTL
jgi:hypothetical protein